MLCGTAIFLLSLLHLCTQSGDFVIKKYSTYYSQLANKLGISNKNNTFQKFILYDKKLVLKEIVDLNEIFDIANMARLHLREEKILLARSNHTNSQIHMADSLFTEIERSMNHTIGRLTKNGFIDKTNYHSIREKRSLFNLGWLGELAGLASSDSVKDLEDEMKAFESTSKTQLGHIKASLSMIRAQIVHLNRFMSIEGQNTGFLERIFLINSKYMNINSRLSGIVNDILLAKVDLENNHPANILFQSLDEKISNSSLISEKNYPLFTFRTLKAATFLKNSLASSVTDNKLIQRLVIPFPMSKYHCEHPLPLPKKSLSFEINCAGFTTNVTLQDCNSFRYNNQTTLICEKRVCESKSKDITCFGLSNTHFMIHSKKSLPCKILNKNSKKSEQFEILNKKSLVTIPVSASFKCDDLLIDQNTHSLQVGVESIHLIKDMTFENLSNILVDEEYKNIHEKIANITKALTEKNKQIDPSSYDKLGVHHSTFLSIFSSILSLGLCCILFSLCCFFRKSICKKCFKNGNNIAIQMPLVSLPPVISSQTDSTLEDHSKSIKKNDSPDDSNPPPSSPSKIVF